MEFRVRIGSCGLRAPVAVYTNQKNMPHIRIMGKGDFRVSRGRRELKKCYFRCVGDEHFEFDRGIDSCYDDNCLSIYDISVVSEVDNHYIGIYNNHVCRLRKMRSDEKADSKVVYIGKADGGEEIRFITMDAIVSEDKMYEIIPSLVESVEPWLVKTVNDEIRLPQKFCEYLIKGNYPVKYIDYFIKTADRYWKMGCLSWLFERWRRLDYNVKELLNDREVIEGLLL